MVVARWCGLRGGVARPSRGCFLQQLGYSIKSNAVPRSAPLASVVPAVIAPKDADMFAGVVAATSHFHSIYGHFVVPVGFRVPKMLGEAEQHAQSSMVSQWPAEFYGFPLGFKLKALLTNPKHREANDTLVNELRDMGFPVDINWREFLWQQTTFAALKVYKELHGDVLVRRNFVVPHGDETWPRPTWGFRLGFRVMNMRQRLYSVSQSEVEDLETIGFVWDVLDHSWTTRMLPALQTFKSVYGHCNVGQAFIVPSEDPWPMETWGMQLGVAVNTLRSPGATYAQQVQRDHEILDEIGFAWDAADEKWSRIVLPAIETFVECFGSDRLPRQRFIVPAAAPWPEAAWFFHLGLAAHYICNKGTYRRQVLQDRQRLEELGLFELLTHRWHRSMLEADDTHHDP